MALCGRRAGSVWEDWLCVGGGLALCGMRASSVWEG